MATIIVATWRVDYTHIYPDLFTSVPSKSAAAFLRVSAFSLPKVVKSIIAISLDKLSDREQKIMGN